MQDRELLAQAAQLGAEQAQVVRRSQLLAVGLTAGDIAAQVTARRWKQVNEAVIVLHNGPMTYQQHVWAVLLSAPPPSALCGLSGARRHGLRGFETATVHVVVVRGAKVLDLPGVPVKIHESRRFGPADIYTINPPYVVSPGRALVDAAAWTRSPLQASRIIVAGVQQRLVSPSEAMEELDRAGKVRHHRMLRQVMHDVEGGARALSEVEFLRFCRRHRLPIPELNVRTTANGKRRYLDAVFRLPDGRVLRVEIDGGIHLTFDTHIADTLRDNDLFLAGAGGGLRFASASIYADDPRAVRQLRQALGLVSP